MLFCSEPAAGYRGIIAIHDTTLGPALGGTRFWNYATEEEAIVLANDTNATGGTVTIVSAPILGTATVNVDGSIRYTPRLNANGNDSFTYTVTVGTQVS